MRADGEFGEDFLLAKTSTYTVHLLHLVMIKIDFVSYSLPQMVPFP